MTSGSRVHFPVVVHMVLRGAAGVYLMRRADHQQFGGLFSLPGGYQEAGEGLHDAAVRECYEETGVRVTRARFAGLMSFRSESANSADSQGVNAIFCALGFDDAPAIREPDKFTSAGFFAEQALPDNCVPWLADALVMAGSDNQAQLIEYVWD